MELTMEKANLKMALESVVDNLRARLDELNEIAVKEATK